MGDTVNQSVFYAAVSSTGVYRSGNGGADRNQVLTLGTNRIARVATGGNGSIAVGIYDSSSGNPTSGTLVAIQHSLDSGATWASLAVPQINFGGQASTDFAIVLDPTNPNIVYVAGDRIATPPYTVTAYRVIRQNDGTSIFETLTDSGTSDGSTTHADARTLAFDALGRLIQGGDGGLYARSNPQGVGTWTGLNASGLSLREAYSVVYDSISKRLVVSAQDNGSASQYAPGSQQYDAIFGGDGVNAQVNDKTLHSQGRSITYTTSQNMAPLIRRIVDTQGNVVSEYTFGTRQGESGLVGVASDDFTATPRRYPDRGLPFGA